LLLAAMLTDMLITPPAALIPVWLHGLSLAPDLAEPLPPTCGPIVERR
jgi:hypothetical protein